jgi:hypothetical protein
LSVDICTHQVYGTGFMSHRYRENPILSFHEGTSASSFTAASGTAVRSVLMVAANLGRTELTGYPRFAETNNATGFTCAGCVLPVGKFSSSGNASLRAVPGYSVFAERLQSAVRYPSPCLRDSVVRKEYPGTDAIVLRMNGVRRDRGIWLSEKSGQLFFACRVHAKETFEKWVSVRNFDLVF